MKKNQSQILYDTFPSTQVYVRFSLTKCLLQSQDIKCATTVQLHAIYVAAIEAGLHGCIYGATPDQGQLTHLDGCMHLNTEVLISRTFLYMRQRDCAVLVSLIVLS